MTLLLYRFVLLIQLYSAHQYLCKTSECRALAERYLANMDKSIPPCEDFYEFACGNYSQHHTVPDDEIYVDVLVEMKKELDSEIENVLVNASRENAPRALKLALTFYDSCSDEAAREEKGVHELLGLVKKLGGWPLFDNSESTMKWEALSAELTLLGVFPITHIFILPSFKNGTQNMLMFDKARIKSSNKQRTQDIFKVLGFKGTFQNEQFDELVKFEKRLVDFTSIMKHSPNLTIYINMMTYGEFKAKYDNIHWTSYFDKFYKKILGGLPDSYIINVANPIYYENLNNFIGDVSEQTIRNYLMLKMVEEYIFHLPAKLREHLGNSKEHNCIMETREKLSIPLATAVFSKLFNEDSADVADAMFHSLKNFMHHRLENSKWMDQSTTNRAMIKLKAMRGMVGAPPNFNNEEAVLQPFHLVRLKPDHYLFNVIALKMASQESHYSKLHLSSDVDWERSIFQTQAFHKAPMNYVQFPPSILRFPLIWPEAPLYVKYGGIGVAIGHEITHGYDSKGSNFDEFGVYRNWWEPDTLDMFRNKTQCFIDRYEQESEPTTNTRVNGKLTIDENIADNGGIRLAYRAYQQQMEIDSSKPQRLPGLDGYNAEQMFFIVYANNFCRAMKPTEIESIMSKDRHALAKLRVNIVLENFPEFSNQFNCSAQKQMSERCRVW